MSVTKDQARRTAQLLYPQLWLSNRVEALVKAIEFLHEADGSNSNDQDPINHAAVNTIKRPATGQPAGIVKQLAEHMKKKTIHVNVVARAVGVSPYTVRTWLEGKYKPNDENSQRIASFIEFQPEEAET